MFAFYLFLHSFLLFSQSPVCGSYSQNILQSCGDNSGATLRWLNESHFTENMQGSRFIKAYIIRSRIKGIDFTHSNNKQLQISNSWLVSCKFNQSNFVGSYIKRTSFDRSEFEGANFSAAKIENVSFRGANLKGAQFDKAVLMFVDFTNADLTDVDFSKATLISVKLPKGKK